MMTAEEEREYELRERGFSHFKPAYFELDAERRSWLRLTADPQRELFAVLDSLPGEQLIPLCHAYDDGEVSTAEDAHEAAWDLAGYMAGEIGDEFTVDRESLDPKVREMLEFWECEEAGEFYE